MHRRIATVALLAALAGAGCEKRVNDETVVLEVTVRVSLGDANQQGTGDVVLEHSDVSEDGRYVVFASKAPGLVANDTNGDADVFIRDLASRTTRLVSVNKFGTFSANGPSGTPTISADGRYVCFQSKADDLHDDDTDATMDIFVRDMVTGTLTLVSRATGAGNKGDGDSSNAHISADGRYVVFNTESENLDGVVGGGPDPEAVGALGNVVDVYRRFVLDPSAVFPTELVSVVTSPGTTKGNGHSVKPWISGDGRYIVWESLAGNLVPATLDGGPDTNGLSDCFLRDMNTGRTSRLNLATVGTDKNANQASDHPVISTDGSRVVYRSNASNLLLEDDGTESDIFVWNRLTGVTIVASVHSSGTQAGNSCNHPSISSDGRIVAFQSGSATLVNGDSNAVVDCFARDLSSGVTSRISVTTFGGEANGDCQRPILSGDGRYIAFWSSATNFADDDTNGAADVFIRGFPR